MQEEEDRVVWSRVGGKTLEWEKAYQVLEPGYYRVVVEAMSESGSEPLNVAIDDLDIGTCPPSE